MSALPSVPEALDSLGAAPSSGVDPVSTWTDVFDILRISTGRQQVTWILVALHGLITVISALGIALRLRHGTARFFERNMDTGMFQLKPATTSQALFSLHALFFVINSRTVFSTLTPTAGAQVFYIVSYIPLGLALYAISFSTLCVYLRQRETSRSIFVAAPARGCCSALAGLWPALLFSLSLVPAAVLLGVDQVRQSEYAEALETAAGAMTTSTTPSRAAFLPLLPLYESLRQSFNGMLRLYRIQASVYATWILVWMAIYIPCAIRLAFVLRGRITVYTRGLKSIRAVDDFTGNAQGVQTENPGRSGGLRFLNCASQSSATVTDMPAPLSPIHDSPPTLDVDLEPVELIISLPSPSFRTSTSAPSSPREPKMPQPRRESRQAPAPLVSLTATRKAELEGDIGKTNRALATLYLQLIVTVGMVVPYLTFCGLLIFRSTVALKDRNYVLWIGCPFAGLALVSSTAFLYFAVQDGRHEPSRTAPPTTGSMKAFSLPQPLLRSPRSPIAEEACATSPPLSPPSPPISIRRLGRALYKKKFFDKPHPALRGGPRRSVSSPSTAASVTAEEVASSERQACTSLERPPISVPVLQAAPPARQATRRIPNSRPNTQESAVDPHAFGAGSQAIQEPLRPQEMLGLGLATVALSPII